MGVKYVRLTDLHLGVSREITYTLHHNPHTVSVVSLSRRKEILLSRGAAGIETDDAGRASRQMSPKEICEERE